MRELIINYKINATAGELFKALTESFALELWTGYPAIMQPVKGTEFELWEGDISGINLEFIENQKIVQEWYFGEQEERSIVTIMLRPKGNATIIEIIHTNIPDDAYDNIRNGWYDTYLSSLKSFYK
jgi:activator of HSP90 ATPase